MAVQHTCMAGYLTKLPHNQVPGMSILGLHVQNWSTP